MIDRLRRATRWEDLLLAAWLVLVDPLLAPTEPAVSDAPSALAGLLGLAGLAGLALCIGARSAPGVSTGLVARGDVAWTVGPLIGAFALVLDDTIGNLGAGEAGPLLGLGLAGFALMARFRLPPLDAVRRRALVTPFILVSAGSFGRFMAGLRDLFDVRSLSDLFGASGLEPSFALFAIGLALAGVLVFYVMLVFAPRQVAEREGTPGSWAVRFLLFVVSLVVGSTWVGILRG